VVSVYEGSDVQLTCVLRATYPPAKQITWFNNHRKAVLDVPTKYQLRRAADWVNLTVREADSTRDSGQYWCSTSNAVGGTEIAVNLLVMSKKNCCFPPSSPIRMKNDEMSSHHHLILIMSPKKRSNCSRPV